eukprot:scaffold48550_cov68-Phaeocystis_antarctica.AAC.5
MCSGRASHRRRASPGIDGTRAGHTSPTPARVKETVVPESKSTCNQTPRGLRYPTGSRRGCRSTCACPAAVASTRTPSRPKSDSNRPAPKPSSERCRSCPRPRTPTAGGRRCQNLPRPEQGHDSPESQLSTPFRGAVTERAVVAMVVEADVGRAAAVAMATAAVAAAAATATEVVATVAGAVATAVAALAMLAEVVVTVVVVVALVTTATVAARVKMKEAVVVETAVDANQYQSRPRPAQAVTQQACASSRSHPAARCYGDCTISLAAVLS